MISENAKEAVNELFARAARDTLGINPTDTIAIQRIHGNGIVERPGSRLVILTVASYTFRLITLFHVDADAATTAYFSRSAPDRDLEEVFGEIGNLCCGAMNRELGRYFPHTGMSTPYTLESGCIRFLQELNPSYVSCSRIGINDELSMHVTLCLCAYAPIDFRVDRDVTPEETGVLELF
jgi:hypothetical protein